MTHVLVVLVNSMGLNSLARIISRVSKKLHRLIPLLEMSDPGPSFREKCLLASRLVFQATDQYSAAVVFACAQLMSLGDMCCKQRLSRQPCMHDARS